MKTQKLLADISRDFFKKHKVITYRMKKIKEMSDEDVIRFCHWYCEENALNDEWYIFREQIESQYLYCSYLQEHIDRELCINIQLVAEGVIKSSALPNLSINIEALKNSCLECRNAI